MIELADITKTFHAGTINENTAIRNLSLKINNGDFVTVIGSNGAGKTSLFNLIAGTTKPTSGKIYLNNKNITDHREYKRASYIGRIFQNPLLGTASNMSIEENMIISQKKGFKGLKISLNRKNRNLFTEELKQLDINLENRLKDEVSLLSGGQRQALTLLMMVQSRPSLILLDEHTAALDPKNAGIVLSLTNKFISEYNLTAMMITHNMGQAIELGNRIIMMDKGEIIFEASGDDKKSLTVQKLVDKFHDIRKKDFEVDKTLLSD